MRSNMDVAEVMLIVCDREYISIVMCAKDRTVLGQTMARSWTGVDLVGKRVARSAMRLTGSCRVVL